MGARPGKPNDYHPTLAERFWPKVERRHPLSCWPWLGAGKAGSYGHMFTPDTNGKRGWSGAHRVSYEVNIGPIPEGHDVHHKCRQRRCVNPAHLVAVDHANHPDAGPVLNRAKTHCKHGHAFTAANTYTTSRGARFCRACGAARKRAARRGKP